MPKVKKSGRGNSSVKAASLDDLPTGDNEDDEDEDNTGASVEDSEDGDESDNDDADSDDTASMPQESENKPSGAVKSSVMTPKGLVKTTLVKITMLDNLTAPRIGQFYLAEVTGVRVMKKGVSYMVPQTAAQVLKGNGKAIIN